jgi:hypothetical protein
MFSESVSIPEDCTKEQYLTILEGLGFTHSEHDVIESMDLPMIRGKTVRINADRNHIVNSYMINTPDL